MKNRYTSFLPVLLIMLVLNHCAHTGISSQNGTGPEYEFAWNFLDVYFIFRERLPEDPFDFSSPVELYASVDEPYTVYHTPQAAQEMLDALTTTTGGLGVRLDSTVSGYLIVDVVPNSPAQTAGLQENDTILSVNGQDIAGLTQQQVAQLLGGRIGDSRRLEIKRQEQRLEITVIIDTFLAPSVFTDSLDQGVAYIYINSFFTRTAIPGGTAEEFRSALQQTQWAEVTILDLRDNPGGEIGQTVEVVSEFLPPGTPIVRSTERMLISSDSGATVESTWVSMEGLSGAVNRTFIVLMNENTASAAEILLASFQAHRPDITTVGSTSFGKARGQAVALTPDSGLAVVTYALLEPINGEGYDMVGIQPEVEVSQGQDALERALELAEADLALTASISRPYRIARLLLLRSMYSLKGRRALAFKYGDHL